MYVCMCVCMCVKYVQDLKLDPLTSGSGASWLASEMPETIIVSQGPHHPTTLHHLILVCNVCCCGPVSAAAASLLHHAAGDCHCSSPLNINAHTTNTLYNYTKR